MAPRRAGEQMAVQERLRLPSAAPAWVALGRIFGGYSTHPTAAERTSIARNQGSPIAPGSALEFE